MAFNQDQDFQATKKIYFWAMLSKHTMFTDQKVVENTHSVPKSFQNIHDAK